MSRELVERKLKGNTTSTILNILDTAYADGTSPLTPDAIAREVVKRKTLPDDAETFKIVKAYVTSSLSVNYNKKKVHRTTKRVGRSFAYFTRTGVGSFQNVDMRKEHKEKQESKVEDFQLHNAKVFIDGLDVNQLIHLNQYIPKLIEKRIEELVAKGARTDSLEKGLNKCFEIFNEYEDIYGPSAKNEALEK